MDTFAASPGIPSTIAGILAFVGMFSASRTFVNMIRITQRVHTLQKKHILVMPA